MPFTLPKEKLVPVEALRAVTAGSFEHLSLRLDDEIAHLAETATFDHGKDVEIARVATFSDRVIVGSGDGRYYSVKYEDINGKLKFDVPQILDVPVLDQSNTGDYVEDYTMKVVDALFSGDKASIKDNIVGLMRLKESIDDNMVDLTTMVTDILTTESAWKTAFNSNYNNIKKTAGKVVESNIQPKYMPLYDGSLEEEKFSSYLDITRRDLGVVAAALLSVASSSEEAYLPFVEKINKSKLSKEESATVAEFAAFADGLVSEVRDLREHVNIAIENEKCAMCLGQIHDAIANSLTDYELAGAFVKSMATRLE